ncbi:lysozyme 2 [Drosophila nasuta]|uniref:lysozyme 2 n=1 Tax=Drosophila nasuta TaxID=42062 RepID=UPI00295EB253|nr:lysozyme 2 [Drosophila nasuta]
MVAYRPILLFSFLGLWSFLCIWRGAAAQDVVNKPVTEDCLECLCETQTGCNASKICVNGACGIFRITLGFWIESGQLTLPNDTSLSVDAFINCVNDPYCAANTIQNYMHKYGQDCNGDDLINCKDFGALHKLGNLNCRADLPYSFAKVFNKCLKRKEQQEAKNKNGSSDLTQI